MLSPVPEILTENKHEFIITLHTKNKLEVLGGGNEFCRDKMIEQTVTVKQRWQTTKDNCDNIKVSVLRSVSYFLDTVLEMQWLCSAPILETLYCAENVFTCIFSLQVSPAALLCTLAPSHLAITWMTSSATGGNWKRGSPTHLKRAPLKYSLLAHRWNFCTGSVTTV